jgi:hypothetical protein
MSVFAMAALKSRPSIQMQGTACARVKSAQAPAVEKFWKDCPSPRTESRVSFAFSQARDFLAARKPS